MSEERRFPLLDRAGGSVPWAVVEPIREIAQRIHGQTLERLAERGGLSRYELGMELVGRSPLAQPRDPPIVAVPPVVALATQPLPDPYTEERLAMKPEGRAIAVAELLRAGFSGRQVSKALKITDAGGSFTDAMVALREPDDPDYLATLTEEKTDG